MQTRQDRSNVVEVVRHLQRDPELSGLKHPRRLHLKALETRLHASRNRQRQSDRHDRHANDRAGEDIARVMTAEIDSGEAGEDQY